MTATDLMFPASLHAAAKINLFLRITGKRTDGYHTLESGVVFTEFGDRITINRAAADKICLTGPFAGDLMKDSGDNICASCLAKFRQAGGVVEPLKIVIEKNIPVGAGLGGGSSDAAALLRHLNQHATTPLSPDALHRLALHLGADVPVCLNMASAHMSGIGEIISPLAVKNAGSILLANPGRALATGDVFKSLTAAEMERQKRHLPCFVQVNTGEEPQKAGVMPGEVDEFIRFCREDCGLDVVGLMCIPPADEEAAMDFALLREMAKRNDLPELSMGMSSDFEEAIAFGATSVRVGSAIFGKREPHS